MFFIGIFGIETKSKEIMDIHNITCKECGRLGLYKLVKQYSYFHFFFIPLFTWGMEYYLQSRCCNGVFGISKEKGKRLEMGLDTVVEDYDLNNKDERVLQIHSCPEYGNKIERRINFCPYCGKKL